MCVIRLYDKFKPMHKTFTKDDLLRYLYGEMKPEDQQELRSVVLEDNKLQAQFLAFKEAKEFLTKVQLSPSEFTVSNILSYDKALTVKPSKQLKVVEFILN